MIKYAITNYIIKYAIVNDVIKYAITNYVINKKINNNFVFPNMPPQLLLKVSCLFLYRAELQLRNKLPPWVVAGWGCWRNYE